MVPITANTTTAISSSMRVKPRDACSAGVPHLGRALQLAMLGFLFDSVEHAERIEHLGLLVFGCPYSNVHAPDFRDFGQFHFQDIKPFVVADDFRAVMPARTGEQPRGPQF